MEKISLEAVANLIPVRPMKSSKFDYGRALIVAGSNKYAGAAILAASACMNSGIGLCYVATDEGVRSDIRSYQPEVITTSYYNKLEFDEFLRKADVIAIGPGLAENANQIFAYVMERISPRQKLIIDATAIRLFPHYPFSVACAGLVFTPHAGELRHLLEESASKDISAFIRKVPSLIVEKSERTRIHTGNRVLLNPLGDPAMAVAGMGDVLTGMIAAFAGIIPSLEEAVICAVFLHSLIGESLAKEQYVVLPSHIIQNIPTYMQQLLENRRKK